MQDQAEREKEGDDGISVQQKPPASGTRGASEYLEALSGYCVLGYVSEISFRSWACSASMST